MIQKGASYLLFMGVCGSGKSSIGGAVAARLQLGFVEGDDFHTDENRMLLAKGQALSDMLRWPWLGRIADAAKATHERDGRPVVIACSALKRIYRDRLRSILGDRVCTIHLTADAALIARRLAARKGHFAGTELLGSQLAILEPLQSAEWGFSLDVSDLTESVVASAVELSRHLLVREDRSGRTG